VLNSVLSSKRFLFVGDVLIFPNILHGFVTSVALLILVHKSCEQSLSYVNTFLRYVSHVTFSKVFSSIYTG